MSTSNEPLNYEYAYIEIRNLLAYTFNVIASEVGDGLTPIDIGVKEDEALKKRRQLAEDIVCTQTHSLHKSPHPITLDLHDELIEKFMYYLTFITCDAAPSGVFADSHPKLDTLRYPNADNDLDETLKSESESDNA
ncbi:hypothetical protein PVK62_13735 [Aliivibrio sp. S3MY1]|uniref:hypothetical protein n=1 Tax=Aliivibrio sp. S3MY1 TaxID=3028424 RepID=UPI0023794CCC|nr:hypothetical protein [Aliivibrio sp. S3MY1]MDD9196885.1 hypothetical protein [Aliivibrio sp. S3MY1]